MSGYRQKKDLLEEYSSHDLLSLPPLHFDDISNSLDIFKEDLSRKMY